MKTTNSKLDHIMYISIPENISKEINGFRVDTGKLLPIETLGKETDFNAGDLSWEMIIAGMLKVLAYNPNHEDGNYYREFIYAVKPGIGNELGSSGIIKAQQKEYDIAIEIFLSLSNLFTDKIEYILNLAISYQEQAKAYEELGKADFAEQFYELAHNAYMRGSTIGEETAQFQYNIGMFYTQINNFEKAQIHLTKFLALDPESENLQQVKRILEMITDRKVQDDDFQKAYDFIQLGKEEEGIKIINKFLETNQDSWNGWFILGWALRKLEKYKEAKEAFLKSMELHDKNIDTYNELAICTMEMAEYTESKKNLEQALRMEPDNLKIISNFGILSLKQNKNDEAVKFFKTVLEFDPEDPIAQKYIEFLKKK